MKKVSIVALALASFFTATVTVRAQFAGTVVSYSSGSGVTPDYTDPSSAIGAPSAVTVDPFFGTSTVDPFNAPYLSSQIVGIGTGGSLTLQFNSPIQNNPNNLYGLDFIIFGHAGFNIVNGDYSGGGITDGSFYAGGDNSVIVSVSADGLTFFTLNPSVAPMVDGLFPTAGNGNPFVPVNPELTTASFDSQNLAGIESLYAGSAGGAGFDLSWAVDGSGHSVALSSVDFVRLENTGNTAYIDAVSTVPEPSTSALAIAGASLLWLKRRKK